MSKNYGLTAAINRDAKKNEAAHKASMRLSCLQIARDRHHVASMSDTKVLLAEARQLYKFVIGDKP